MNQPDICVHVPQRRSKLMGVCLCKIRFQAHLTIVAKLADEVVQGAALDQIHDAEGSKVGDEARVELQYVRMVQIAPNADLIVDSLLSLVILSFANIGDRLADNLDSTLDSAAVIVHTDNLLDKAEPS
jgi:hypothetical protein